jgi:uncharacterized protein (TIGR02145 family)
VTPKYIALAILLLTFTAHSGDSTITYANKTYKTVKIGEQTWLAENLNYEAEGSVCYENNPANCAKYGRLYNWQTAMKVCPKGWHLPSNAEWDKLLRFVDGDKGTESPYASPAAGEYLKAKSGWNEDGNGTDAHGFSALPGGAGNSEGVFGWVGNFGLWWSANENKRHSDYAFIHRMYFLEEGVYWHDDFDKSYYLFSVRCVKD